MLAAALAVAPSFSFIAQAQTLDGDFEGERTYKQADGKEVEIKEPAKKDRGKIQAMMRAGKAATAEEEKLISDHFRFRVAELTWKENIPNLDTKRESLKKELGQLGRAEAADLHVRLNKLLLDEMQKVVVDKRYPRAVRVNAVLLIGELDQREPKGLDAGVPLPEAEPVLLGFLNDESLHDALRIDALVGLMRHAESGMPANRNAELVDEMTKLLEAKESPKGKDSVGRLWLRMLACDMFEILATKGPEANQPKVIAAVEAFLAEKGEKGPERWMRCHAAKALGAMEAKSLQSTSQAAAQSLAAMVVDISKTHDRLLEAAGVEASKKKKKTSAAANPTKEGEEEAPPAIPENVQKVASEVVVEDLFRVRFGLVGVPINAKEKYSTDRGLYAASDPAGQKFIQEVVDSIDKMVKKLKDTKKTTVELLADVAAEGATLEARLKTANADKAPEGENTEKVAEPATGNAKTVKEPGRASTKPPAGNSGATESAVGTP
jgi:hypothetical protein